MPIDLSKLRQDLRAAACVLTHIERGGCAHCGVQLYHRADCPVVLRAILAAVQTAVAAVALPAAPEPATSLFDVRGVQVGDRVIVTSVRCTREGTITAITEGRAAIAWDDGASGRASYDADIIDVVSRTDDLPDDWRWYEPGETVTKGCSNYYCHNDQGNGRSFFSGVNTADYNHTIRDDDFDTGRTVDDDQRYGYVRALGVD